jgi:hypothetical protein
VVWAVGTQHWVATAYNLPFARFQSSLCPISKEHGDFWPDVLSLLDLSTEHNALEMENRLEAAIYTWKRRIYSRQSISIEDGKTGVKSSWSLVKESENELGRKELYMERADNILLNLKNKLPSIPQSPDFPGHHQNSVQQGMDSKIACLF